MNDIPVQNELVITVRDLTAKYPGILALNQVSFDVERGTIFGFLGPNGSGKSTLFRILSTAQQSTSGTITLGGQSLKDDRNAIRKKIGVIFQSPSIDGKLTVFENMQHFGWCYGLSGSKLRDRIYTLTEEFALDKRLHTQAETLSGGMTRKLEIAKSLISQPDVLIMDEPGTGLDPRARKELWEFINRLNRNQNITVLVTTHLMDEAEHCHDIAILDQGNLVVQGSPHALKADVGDEVVEVETDQINDVRFYLHSEVETGTTLAGNTIRFNHPDGHHLVPRLISRFPTNIQSVQVRKPSLEDVFIHYTGHTFDNEGY